jgi:hypothetical protein
VVVSDDVSNCIGGPNHLRIAPALSKTTERCLCSRLKCKCHGWGFKEFDSELIDYTDPNYKKHELTSELIRALYEKHKPRFENHAICLGQCSAELVPLLVGALSLS